MTGEGEYALPDLVKTGDGPGIHDAGIISDIDTLPFPSRTLFDMNVVVNKTGIHTTAYKGSGEATTILTSRGCPYECAYCCKIPQTSKVRLRSPENIIDEIHQVMQTYNVCHFRFPDDMFTVSRSRVMKLCDLILNEGLEIYWMCITRLDSVDDALLEKMYAAGCREISCGVESGSQRMLNAMNKRTTVEKNKEGIAKIKASGMEVKEFLIFGFPGEDDESVNDTMQFVLDTRPDKVTLSTFVPLPGSDVWRNPEKYGIDIKSDWGEYYFYWDEGQEFRGFPYRLRGCSPNGLVYLRSCMQKFIRDYRDGKV